MQEYQRISNDEAIKTGIFPFLRRAEFDSLQPIPVAKNSVYPDIVQYIYGRAADRSVCPAGLVIDVKAALFYMNPFLRSSSILPFLRSS